MLSTADFTYVPATRTLVAEASEHPFRTTGIRTQYKVKSQKTGAVVTFDRVRTEFDNENDLVAWHFIGRLPNGKTLNMTIFND